MAIRFIVAVAKLVVVTAGSINNREIIYCIEKPAKLACTLSSDAINIALKRALRAGHLLAGKEIGIGERNMEKCSGESFTGPAGHGLFLHSMAKICTAFRWKNPCSRSKINLARSVGRAARGPFKCSRLYCVRRRQEATGGRSC